MNETGEGGILKIPKSEIEAKQMNLERQCTQSCICVTVNVNNPISLEHVTYVYICI